MQIDVWTIFPEYLAPLELSLIGQARRKGLLGVDVHDVRDFAHDRHRTVDDTPYGGGAGMVMKPEPWGEALDAAAAARPGERLTLIVPNPGGEVFDQALAAELATLPWLGFACGRYEGIDERVYDEARGRVDLRLVSLGDYVLNGGEVAALAMIEAIVRLLPGVVGNPQSLVEESHQDGLLEYPVYTKPPSWRGHEVPPVLLAGNHGAIAAWRHEQRLRRTAERRPDLLAPAAAAGAAAGELRLATPSDLGELFTLTQACWLTEAMQNDTFAIPALHESLDDARAELARWQTWVLRLDGRLVASARGRRLDEAPQTWEIGRLMVAPDLRGRGFGRRLLEHVEASAPPEVTRFELFTGERSEANLRRYRRAGYRPTRDSEPVPAGAVRLAKRRRPAAGGQDSGRSG